MTMSTVYKLMVNPIDDPVMLKKICGEPL